MPQPLTFVTKMHISISSLALSCSLLITLSFAQQARYGCHEKAYYWHIYSNTMVTPMGSANACLKHCQEQVGPLGAFQWHTSGQECYCTEDPIVYDWESKAKAHA